MSAQGSRITDHPVLTFPPGRRVTFTFDGRELEGVAGEPIAAIRRTIAVSFTVRSFPSEVRCSHQ